MIQDSPRRIPYHTLAGVVSIFYDLAEGRSPAIMKAAIPETGASEDGHASSHAAPSYLMCHC
jgi:hypothetical protein